jgi:hypothetical protein
MQRLREIERQLDALVRQTQLGSADEELHTEYEARLAIATRMAEVNGWYHWTVEKGGGLPNKGICMQNAYDYAAFVWIDASEGGWLCASVNSRPDRPMNPSSTERVSDLPRLYRYLRTMGFM